MAAFITALLATASYILPAAAQLSGSVGPTSSTADKVAKICNIMDYGGVASATEDNGAAIQSAWDDCKTGGQVYIPEGDYGLSTWLTLKNGANNSFNLEGTLYRVGTDGGNMIMIRDTHDFEFYSATSKGGMQGYGYEFLKDDTYGPRLLRFYKCTDFSVHDIALVDSPAFHLSLDTCTNGELYNMIIRGANRGGLDGIDVWGTNIWIHDIEVTNKDECVTVKDPSANILVEQVHCNWSGGCAMGSLASGIDIHDIEYNNIYTHHANQMFMIKSNGGSGNVYNLAFNNFVGHSNAYTLDFDSAWSSMSTVDGDGIQYSNVSFRGWRGTCSDGTERGPVKVLCPAGMPCTDISIDDFHVWTESGDEVYHACYNAYGSGSCLEDGDATTTYTSTVTLTTETSYSYATMADELTTGLGLSAPIAVPTMPASFFPGLAPISAILNGASAAVASSVPAVTASSSSSALASPTSVTETAAAVTATEATEAEEVASSTNSPITSAPTVTSAAVATQVATTSARRPGRGSRRHQRFGGK
ncbi:pectin lyase fold/virulence factor [Pseudomassariella vexata]|uniref:Pectin lyase fold/virulence factor n=1 Tax=Pseudomassariella vexata TaxID=1141098 RepID=A0A1Y2DHP2_9PEZI|nr:pectin lyase fold/virulence factor [Pseudomassariella vexata]ORY58759.1 pectin lyase fold/virulence factor [Pseudomassariella vexata]